MTLGIASIFFFFNVGEGSVFFSDWALKGACYEFQEPFASVSLPLIRKSGSPS